jgi:hypothetical protein
MTSTTWSTTRSTTTSWNTNRVTNFYQQ